MEKEYLKKYREKLCLLSEEDKKLRDIYLSKISKGEIQGPMTGYASIDKPNLAYYSDSALIEDIPKKTMSKYLDDIFSKDEDAICIEYYGTKISRNKFKKIRNKVRDNFSSFGIKKGDIVSVISVTTPEVIYIMHALNQLGAVINLVDPRLSVDNLKEKCASSKIIVSLDLASPKIAKVKREDQKVIYTSITDSFSSTLKTLYNMKNKAEIKDEKYMTWSDFMKIKSKEAKVVGYEPNMPAIMVSTSGTTGPSKLAVLSNENINAVAWQYENSGIQHKLGDVFLNIMPAFLSYGAVAGIHMPLSLGFKTVIIPKREFEEMGKLIMKHKPQAYLDIPTGYEYLKKSNKINKQKLFTFKIFNKKYNINIDKKSDLSFLINPGVGGDHLSLTLEQSTNNFLKDHNNDNLVAKGYGMTEVSSAAIVNVNKNCNSLGSVGVPFVKTLAKIADPETLEELPYNTEGELLLSTPALFLGYMDNTKLDSIKIDHKATDSELITDEFGNKWIRTGDYFLMTPNGELFFKGRKKTMFVRPDGHNNHPMEMTELLLKHPAVKDAFTVGIPSPYHEQGKYPKSAIVLKNEYKGHEEEIQKELEELCMSQLSQRDVPYYYTFVDELPMTPGGKIDFVSLEKEGTEKTRMAQILIDEQNLNDVKVKKLK